MSIKCGRGNHTHESVQDVRACYNGQSVASAPRQYASKDQATPAQLKFLNSLRATLGLAPFTGEISKRECSRAIDDHKIDVAALPKTAAPIRRVDDGTVNVPDVPAGHYAVASLTGNNDLDFFRVDRPTDGRWAGRTFTKRVIGGKPNSPVRGATARKALEAILAADPAKAAKRYADEIGRCSRCNRHLTDEISRQFGMGPECRSK
jgi:hypothetical protein